MANSPADRQVDANDQVEALARGLQMVEKELREEARTRLPGRIIFPTWDLLTESQRDRFRQLARRLLLKDYVRLGKGLPETPKPKMKGQQELDLP